MDLELELDWTILATLVVAALLTGLMCRTLLARGMLDVPNARSSHDRPMPRGGGIAIVVSSALAWLVLGLIGLLPRNDAIALLGGGLAVAVVGLVDDRFGLSARVRLSVHLLAALWALVWLSGLPPLLLGTHTTSFGVEGYVLGILGVVWTLNLFNFMDGIDGIAASEATFIAAAGAGLAIAGGDGLTLPASSLVFAAACSGFLMWNWPPARIFMGDVGSGYLGFVIAVLAIIDAREHSTALLVWLILGGVFFVDATVTLLRRMVRREPLHVAHRTHAYQWLSRRWSSHRSVTLAMLGVNVLWLLPLAWCARNFPPLAGWMAVLALAPLALVALRAGAGRPERTPRRVDF